ncbi:MAG: FMN-binding protein [Porticoccaceae bacterium]|nr:MAG: FMN-binding protein [Porticoccaceae bacterium]
MKLLPARVLLLALVALCLPVAEAEGVYLTPDEFRAQAFGGAESTPQTLWLSAPLKDAAAEILGHPFAQLRVRYWRHGDRTAWVLDEIGKTHPITIGVVVEQGAVEAIRVLEFRESRGEEVRLPFFTDQFVGAGLRAGDGRELDRGIDGITGATLSVRAMQRVARLALFFHGQVLRPASPSGDGE